MSHKNATSADVKSWSEVANEAEVVKRAKASDSNVPQSDLHRTQKASIPTSSSIGNPSTATQKKTWAQVAAEAKAPKQERSHSSSTTSKIISSATPVSTRDATGNRRNSVSAPPNRAKRETPMAAAGRSATQKKTWAQVAAEAKAPKQERSHSSSTTSKSISSATPVSTVAGRTIRDATGDRRDSASAPPNRAKRETPTAGAGRSARNGKKKQFFVMVPKAVGELLIQLERRARNSPEIEKSAGHSEIVQLSRRYSNPSTPSGTMQDMKVPRKEFYAFIAPLLSETEHVFRFAIQDESGRTVQIKPAAYQVAQDTLVKKATSVLKNGDGHV
jgi:hypothetical protein